MARTQTRRRYPHQSAFIKHHSTETALLYIHHHLINAIGSQKVSCLCLLDPSAAFDTIDHNILLTCLSSWFGIQGSALDWFKSYLSSRSFRVKCKNNFHSCHTCSMWCPSRFGSWSSTVYVVRHPSQYSSSLSLNHRHIADGTQLFFPFCPSVFDSNITQLQHSLQQISSWMTANLLTLNSSKTQFLLIGLPQQLAKINTISLITTHSAATLVFTALHGMQTRSSDENSVCPSVRPSVRLSNACFMTKWKKDRSRFLYHTKDHLD